MGSLGDWQTLWSWIVAHRFEMLSALYLASVLCSVLLAGCVYFLGRRLARLGQYQRARMTGLEDQVRAVDNRLAALTPLMEQMAAVQNQVRAADERLTTLASLMEQMAARSSSAMPAAERSGAMDAVEAIRAEVGQLLAELGGDERQNYAETRKPVPLLGAE